MDSCTAPGRGRGWAQQLGQSSHGGGRVAEQGESTGAGLPLVVHLEALEARQERTERLQLLRGGGRA